MLRLVQLLKCTEATRQNNVACRKIQACEKKYMLLKSYWFSCHST